MKHYKWKLVKSHGKRTQCARGSIRTKKLPKGKLLRICCPRGKWKPRAKRCSAGTRAYEIGTPK